MVKTEEILRFEQNSEKSVNNPEKKIIISHLRSKLPNLSRNMFKTVRSRSKNVLMYTSCGLAKIRLVHTYVMPWMFYFGGQCKRATALSKLLCITRTVGWQKFVQYIHTYAMPWMFYFWWAV